MFFDHDLAVTFNATQLVERELSNKIFVNDARLDVEEFDALAYINIDDNLKLVRANEVTGQTNIYLAYFKPSGEFINKLLVYGSYDIDEVTGILFN